MNVHLFRFVGPAPKTVKTKLMTAWGCHQLIEIFRAYYAQFGHVVVFFEGPNSIYSKKQKLGGFVSVFGSFQDFGSRPAAGTKEKNISTFEQFVSSKMWGKRDSAFGEMFAKTS